jgi:8-oxo-dGTP diphosphatase
VLLGVKKRGFGQGRIVAPGGHLEPGESAEQACVREVAEEVGLVVDGGDLVAAGGVLFDFPDRPGWDLHVAVFRAQRFTGDAVESDELVPAWYPIGDLPWDEMWPDARHWLPPVLSGAAIEAAFTLSASGRIRTFHAEPRDVPRGT